MAHALLRDGHSEQDAIRLAIGVMERWAAGGGDVSDETRAHAAAAVAEWERMRAEWHSRSAEGTRDGAAFAATESSSAGDLLPVGPSERQAQAIVAAEKRKRAKQAQPHAHRGVDLEHCSLCERSVADPVHGLTADARRRYRPDPTHGAGARHRGPDGHKRLTTGHVGQSLHRRRLASKMAFDADCDEVEPQILAAVLELFRRQQTAVLARLEQGPGKGKRARQALSKARAAVEGERAQPANQQGNPPPPAKPAPAVSATLTGVAAPAATTATGALAALSSFPPAIAAQALALAAAVFDVAFWTAATAGILWAVYQRARELAITRVDAEIGHASSLAEAAKASETTTNLDTSAAKAEDLIEEATSAAAAQATAAGEMPPEPPPGPLTGGTAGPGQSPTPGDMLRQRANRMAATVTETTFEAIAEALATGLEEGEPIGVLTNYVRAVFSTSRARAEMIARTETIGALNEAANAQAEWLGPDHVARKEWMAHHDNRTRPTHRIADGQTVPIGHPFHVGQSLMQHPGDPTAPASETCNCRCALAFLPPGAERIPR